MKGHTSLVISISGVLNAILNGAVTAEDLKGAVFFVGGYERAMSIPMLMRQITRSVPSDSKRLACETLSQALDMARRAGRLAWRHSNGDSWEQLNGLLDTCGLPRISPIDRDCPPRGRYAYSWVAEAVDEQGLPYRVIWS